MRRTTTIVTLTACVLLSGGCAALTGQQPIDTKPIEVARETATAALDAAKQAQADIAAIQAARPDPTPTASEAKADAAAQKAADTAAAVLKQLDAVNAAIARAQADAAASGQNLDGIGALLSGGAAVAPAFGPWGVLLAAGMTAVAGYWQRGRTQKQIDAAWDEAHRLPPPPQTVAVAVTPAPVVAAVPQ
jgi:hypothetical protein